MDVVMLAGALYIVVDGRIMLVMRRVDSGLRRMLETLAVRRTTWGKCSMCGLMVDMRVIAVSSLMIECVVHLRLVRPPVDVVSCAVARLLARMLFAMTVELVSVRSKMWCLAIDINSLGSELTRLLMRNA